MSLGADPSREELKPLFGKSFDSKKSSPSASSFLSQNNGADHATSPIDNYGGASQESLSAVSNAANTSAVSNTTDHQSALISKSFDNRNFLLRWFHAIFRMQRHFARNIGLASGETMPKHQSYPANVVRNQKYSFIFFLPMVLIEQFKFFSNMYFLLVALSQFIPPLKVGFLFTYIAPLLFVLSITILKEAYDDLKRWNRDREANSQRYKRLTPSGVVDIPSSKIKVGHLIIIDTDQRVPADCVLLRTTEKSGASFIRTDQLDGETDWKLRHAVPCCQKLKHDTDLFDMNAIIYAEAPKKQIYDFVGTFTRYRHAYSTDEIEEVDPLNLENTLWANCVIASGTVVALVVYTGIETRSAMNASTPKAKVGKLDEELNLFSKFLFVLMVVLALALVALKKFQGLWFVNLFRFILLFSSIIPISMRVNLDMGKTLYSLFIMRDKNIPGTIVRNSSIPEELGRIDYLFSDKTGTLTQNEMVFKKLHTGVRSFNRDTVSEISEHLQLAFNQKVSSLQNFKEDLDDAGESRNLLHAVYTMEMMKAVSICHNVTPVMDHGSREYQASSPDEIALVKFCESVGVTLHDRTLQTITLKVPRTVECDLSNSYHQGDNSSSVSIADAEQHDASNLQHFEVLNIFPFSSEAKRMSIIVKDRETGEIAVYMKGADTIMAKAIKPSDWLEEECDTMAQEGLRTLVFAKKSLTLEQYNEFSDKLHAAKTSLSDRATLIQRVRETVERDMTLLGVTGVEDKLQDQVQESLESLRNAGIRIWMLTGDKVETAICIARSARLVSRSQPIFKLIAKTAEETLELLDEYASQTDSALVVDGTTLAFCLENKQILPKFQKLSCLSTAVVCCRCSPTQKADIVSLIRRSTGKRTAAIGDGGNDVSMILAANCGIGIVGKEGKHASLAADFSIEKFFYVTRLLMWHGRNSYKRSARLSQFVIHRGLIISFIQAVFSSVYYFVAIPIYTGWLLVGYSTFYTMLPVFSIVLDNDVKEEYVFRYPELYKELLKGRSLNFKSFLVYLFKSVYQAGVIVLLTLCLFENSFIRIVTITFTALILTELLMVVFEVHNKFNWIMWIAEFVSLLMYVASIFLLQSYFDIMYILTYHFLWKVIVIVLVSLVPIYLVKFINKRLNPPVYMKLEHESRFAFLWNILCCRRS